MILNILKRDLKRKKTMNIIILLFVILSTTFVASSINNIVTVMNGIDYYFDQARLGDYVVASTGENAYGVLDEFLETEESVKDYRIEDVYVITQDNITSNGRKLSTENTGLVQELSGCKLNYFDKNNNVIKHVDKGEVYVPSKFLKSNDLKVGDSLTIELKEAKVTLKIVGVFKDALMGSQFMGNYRFLISDEDYEVFENAESIQNTYRGQIAYIDSDNVKALAKALSDVDKIAFSGDRDLLKMLYIMEMIVAGILIVVSVCLIIVAFIVLKFTINFTLVEEFREIGVMKAIGIKDRKIRGIYLIKYAVISIVGAVVGLIASIPFGDLMMKSVSENMMLGNNKGVALNIVSAVVVVLIIIGHAYRCTGKVKKYSPIDAIRNGQTGERFKKKSSLRIGKSHFKPNTFMAFNDVKSSPLRYLTIVLAFAICSLLVFMVVNTTETMKSDKFLYTFGKECDAYLVDMGLQMDSMAGEGNVEIDKALASIEKKMADNGYEINACVEVQYKYKAEFDGGSYLLTCQQGKHTKTSDYVYYKGSAPANIHEIAITEQISKQTGAKIGDTITIYVEGSPEEFLVVGYFQTMNNLGELVRLHEDVPTNMGSATGLFAFGIDFTDNPSDKEIDKRVKDMKRIFDTEDVMDGAEYSRDCIGVVDTMAAVEMLLLAITMIVVILVAILMERSFISDEKGEIAILKAIGFSDASIIAWHVKRFVLVSIIAVLLAVALSIPATKLCITPIFGMMGMKTVSYEYNFVKLLLIYPGIIIALMVVAVTLTALYTKKITSRDAASIE